MLCCKQSDGFLFVLMYRDKEKVDKIITSLNLKISPRDLKSKDLKTVISAVMSQWLPLSSTVLLSVVDQIPSPNQASKKKWLAGYEKIPPYLKEALKLCDKSVTAPTIVYISKLFSVDKDALPGRKRIQLTAEQMRERKALMAAAISKESDSITSIQKPDTATSLREPSNEEEDINKLLGFARIFSGTVRVGQEIYALGPKYSPETPNLHCSRIKVSRLFMMMGRDMEDLDQVPAGNVFAIDGVAESILK